MKLEQSRTRPNGRNNQACFSGFLQPTPLEIENRDVAFAEFKAICGLSHRSESA